MRKAKTGYKPINILKVSWLQRSQCVDTLDEIFDKMGGGLTGYGGQLILNYGASGEGDRRL